MTVLNYQNCDTYFGVSGEERTANVVHYRINNAGHSWPVLEAEREASLEATRAALGQAAVEDFLPLNSDINASAEIWKFFEQR